MQESVGDLPRGGLVTITGLSGSGKSADQTSAN
jgi:hypothetical protein